MIERGLSLRTRLWTRTTTEACMLQRVLCRSVKDDRPSRRRSRVTRHAAARFRILRHATTTTRVVRRRSTGNRARENSPWSTVSRPNAGGGPDFRPNDALSARRRTGPGRHGPSGAYTTWPQGLGGRRTRNSRTRPSGLLTLNDSRQTPSDQRYSPPPLRKFVRNFSSAIRFEKPIQTGAQWTGKSPIGAQWKSLPYDEKNFCARVVCGRQTGRGITHIRFLPLYTNPRFFCVPYRNLLNLFGEDFLNLKNKRGDATRSLLKPYLVLPPTFLIAVQLRPSIQPYNKRVTLPSLAPPPQHKYRVPTTNFVVFSKVHKLPGSGIVQNTKCTFVSVLSNDICYFWSLRSRRNEKEPKANRKTKFKLQPPFFSLVIKLLLRFSHVRVKTPFCEDTKGIQRSLNTTENHSLRKPDKATYLHSGATIMLGGGEAPRRVVQKIQWSEFFFKFYFSFIARHSVRQTTKYLRLWRYTCACQKRTVR